MKILVLNAGSSSLKYRLFDGEESLLIQRGMIEDLDRSDHSCYAAALINIEETLRRLDLINNLGECDAIAHRVVHGGEVYHEPIIITDRVIQSIDKLSQLAPLHNPVNLLPVKTLAKKFPKLLQIAVFDTAFHQTLPDYAYRYALPSQFYHKHSIRRYGFHGTSHHYLTERFARLNNKPKEEVNIISLHLGNGASICAVERGISIDTSMGLTPLEGLIMGSRSGDLDPAIPLYLIRQLGYSAMQVDQILNQQSGLLGLCGKSDMRSILQLAEQNDEKAILAKDMFVYHIIKYVGSYIAIMDELDAIIFSGGIGEHAVTLREQILERFAARFNILVDKEKNLTLSENGNEGIITHAGSHVEAWVIPTNEEWLIAQQSLNLINP